ncbi:MAG: M42 family metallopeptidase [Ruminococcaceae bacterium]|nr:M42 family metallopeptidase [Oscillospiraceae bacterium]
MEFLKKLCTAIAPSGNESSVHDIIKNEIRAYVDEITTDALGNLIAHKKGAGKKVMLAAHADEIGIIVTYIEKSGLIRFHNIGGVRPLYALSQRVKFLNGIAGVVFYDMAKDIEKISFDDMYIDIGAKSDEEAEKLVNIGDVAGFVGEFFERGDAVVSKALDDRVGCYILIKALKRAQNTDNDVYAVFTSQEELGLRGAATGAYSINPDIALAIDVTDTGDMPGTAPMAVTLGGGAAIKIKDSRSISSGYVVNLLKRLAKDNNLPYQLEVLTRGGTDAGAIHMSRGGVKTATLSVPTRYIHSPCEMVSKTDIETCITLTQKFIEERF